MNACEITTVIAELHKLPYKTILISGAWGIGKSYAVKKALSENFCIISLFGIKKMEDIYHNLFFKIYGKFQKKTVDVISKVFDDIASVLSEYSDTVKGIAAIKNMVSSFVSEKELLFQGLNKLDNQYIIVLDDLERLSKDIDIAEVFGIIDELKTIEKVKLIIVANIEEMGKHREVFDLYCEKIIDRVYLISEPSFDVDWAKIGIDDRFAKDFISNHKVKNLRTMKKAQNFYEEVRALGGIDDLDFLSIIRKLCYGVVVEITDELYIEEIDDNNRKSMDSTEYSSANERLLIYGRISGNYLKDIWCSSTLLNMILTYYYESEAFNKEQYKAEYEMFLKAGEISNFYKSEAEIKIVVSNWKSWFSKSANANELSRFAEEAVKLTELLEEPTDEIIEEFKNKLSELIWNIAIQKGIGVLSHESFLYYSENRALSEATQDVVSVLRKRIITKYISQLERSMNEKGSIEISYQLRQCYNNSRYNEIVKENCWGLLKKESFPIENMTEEKYHTCFNVLYILRKTDQDKYDLFVDELIKQCDKMAVYRIECINRDIDGKK